MKTIAGIDTSTHTGLVVLGQDGSVQHASEIEAPKKVVGLDRAEYLANMVVQVLAIYKPGLVLIEGYSFHSVHNAQILIEIGTMIRYGLRKMKLPVVEVAPSRLKKFVLGKGVGPKEQIMLAVYKQWGFTSDTNNIGDAYALARLAKNLIWEDRGLNKAQKEVLADMLASH